MTKYNFYKSGSADRVVEWLDIHQYATIVAITECKGVYTIFYYTLS